MTLSGQSAAKFAVMHNGPHDVVSYRRWCLRGVRWDGVAL